MGPAGPTGPTGPTGRLWGVAVTSGLLGATLALGAVVLLGQLGGTTTERIVERVGVRDQLGDAFTLRTSPGLPDIVASVDPSVVRLAVESAAGSSAGAGVVVLDDGHIITNAHVVADARTVTIVLADGTTVAGEVVGIDEVTDLALIVARDDGLDSSGHSARDLTWSPAVRGSADDLRIGDPAAVIAPGGTTGNPTVVVGMVSALQRLVRAGEGAPLHGMIQTDLPVAAGASGAALCDRTGRVVGIVTPVGNEEGLGFATPMDAAWAAAEAILADGEVHHVWLGIEGSDLGATDSSLLGIIAPGGGVVVDRVVPGGPAEAAGLVDGDVLTAVDGVRFATLSQLVVALRGYEPGDVVALALVRGGNQHEIPVALGELDG